MQKVPRFFLQKFDATPFIYTYNERKKMKIPAQIVVMSLASAAAKAIDV